MLFFDSNQAIYHEGAAVCIFPSAWDPQTHRPDHPGFEPSGLQAIGFSCVFMKIHHNYLQPMLAQIDQPTCLLIWGAYDQPTSLFI